MLTDTDHDPVITPTTIDELISQICLLDIATEVTLRINRSTVPPHRQYDKKMDKMLGKILVMCHKSQYSPSIVLHRIQHGPGVPPIHLACYLDGE